MTDRMINNRISKLFDLEAKKNELEAQIDALKKEIQDEMKEQDVDVIDTGKFVVRWSVVTSERFDTKKFKEEHEDVAALYIKPSSYRRFSYSVTRGKEVIA